MPAPPGRGLRTRVELVAAPDGRGGTALVLLRADGALAARRTGSPPGTGAARVHLVGTAAGPLGGDVVEVAVRVRTGAALVVRGVAATLALPSRGGTAARTSLHLVVEDGAHLDVALEPVVVARGADLHAATTVDVAAGGSLDLTEQVVLGRWREAAGRWSGSLTASLGGRPWLVQHVALGDGSPTWDALDAPRAYLSRLRTDEDAASDARCAGRAALLPLARGGSLLEALGADLRSAHADAAALDGTGPGRTLVEAAATPRPGAR